MPSAFCFKLFIKVQLALKLPSNITLSVEHYISYAVTFWNNCYLLNC